MSYSAPHSEDELLTRARQLAGQTLQQLAKQLQQSVPANLNHNKGWIGQLLEVHLGANSKSLPQPDFPQLGIELKTIPIKADGSPKESTYVCTVPMQNTIGLDWETAWLKQKLERVLWLPIEADATIPLQNRRVGQAILWSPSQSDMMTLRADWEELMDLVCLGQIEHITARHGTYLQIRPKAANSKALVYSSDELGNKIPTLPRGFYLRTRFTKHILQQHYSC